MDLCIKTQGVRQWGKLPLLVSILVLMDLCIKTLLRGNRINLTRCFNPCFNGSMYKNEIHGEILTLDDECFNPCFNGSMYKNRLFNFTSYLH